MKKASEFRAHAQECRQLAQQMSTPVERAQLLRMAENWEQMARDRVALIRRHPELATAEERREEGLAG